MTVFITDGAERTSLAIARSLGKEGIEVHVGESYRFSTTGLSKYCKRSFIYPYHPKKNGLEIGEEKKFVEFHWAYWMERFWF